MAAITAISGSPIPKMFDAVPVHGDAVQQQRLVVQLQDHQQEHEEQGHEDAHDRRGSPARHHLAVLGVQGAEQVSQAGALSHDGAVLSGREKVWLL